MNPTNEKNSQLGNLILKTRSIVIDVDHTNKKVVDVGSIVLSFLVDDLILDQDELGVLREVLEVRKISGAATAVSGLIDGNGDLAIDIDGDAIIEVIYRLA